MLFPCHCLQSFEFSDVPGAGIGFTQHANGPCGLLASTLAEVIAHLLFRNRAQGATGNPQCRPTQVSVPPHLTPAVAIDPRTLFLEPSDATQRQGLVWALARCVTLCEPRLQTVLAHRTGCILCVLFHAWCERAWCCLCACVCGLSCGLCAMPACYGGLRQVASET